MMIEDRDRKQWLELWHSMNDEELTDQRYELYDLAEVAERGSEPHEFVRWALAAIGKIEQRWRSPASTRDVIRDHIAAAWPDLDADVFVDALRALDRGRRELGIAEDVQEVWRGALEVAERRRDAAEDR